MTYNEFVFDEIRRIGRAWISQNQGHVDQEVLFEKIGEMCWRRLIDKKSVKQIMEEIGVNPSDYGESTTVITMPEQRPDKIVDLTTWPRAGLSIAGLIVNRNYNIQETFKRYVEAGATSTRINILSARWPSATVLPYTQDMITGKWDLYNWNNEYFERLAEIKETAYKCGIVVVWTNYELYSWSKRKSGPQQDDTPWRNNVNGIHWDESDETLYILPDEWSAAWIQKMVPLLDLKYNVFETGNEMPEKGLHTRTAKLVRKFEPDALIQVNRNEDTPGQYVNMKVGKQDFDFLSLHGAHLKEKSDLKKKFPREPDYKTFEEFMDDCPHERHRVTFSSDGARTNTYNANGTVKTSRDSADNPYDWDKLKEWFRYVRSKGYNIEHQSRAKMTDAPNHHMIEVEWFKSVIE